MIKIPIGPPLINDEIRVTLQSSFRLRTLDLGVTRLRQKTDKVLYEVLMMAMMKFKQHYNAYRDIQLALHHRYSTFDLEKFTAEKNIIKGLHNIII
jgi:hypothetical protein